MTGSDEVMTGSDEDFWSRLVAAFEERGLGTKQVDISKRYNVTQPSVHRWKEGKNLPTPETIIQMAEDGNVCVEWLYTGRGEKHPPISEQSTDREILDLLRNLDESSKQEVLRWVQFACEPRQPNSSDPEDLRARFRRNKR
jgi:hypothetical protein